MVSQEQSMETSRVDDDSHAVRVVQLEATVEEMKIN